MLLSRTEPLYNFANVTFFLSKPYFDTESQSPKFNEDFLYF